MKKNSAWLCLVILLGLAATAPGSNWTLKSLFFSLGSWPSMALTNGMFPVLSNGMEVYTFDPYGTNRWWGWSGCLAGDGVGQMVFNAQPVKYGADGQFYSTAYPVPVRQSTTGGWQAVGPDFLGGYPLWSVCSADPSGCVYMVSGNVLGMTRGSDWQTVTLPLFAWDLAVSKFGDVAVAGFLSGSGVNLGVAWFDYKAGIWLNRSFGSVPVSRRVAVEFDALGNLGVAYVNSRNELRYAYLDMGQNYWTDDLVAQISGETYEGAALAFDAANQPVIAAGRTLASNPVAFVTGTVELGDYSPGPQGMVVSIELRRTDRPDPVWTYTPSLYSDGKFYVPKLVASGTYDVAVKVSHWLRRVVCGVAVGESGADVGTISLVNGDCDNSNGVDNTDLSQVLAAIDITRSNPGFDPAADLDGDGEVTSTDLSIVMRTMDGTGDP